MKSIIPSMIIAFLCFTTSFAQGSDLPSIEEKWTFNDYKKISGYLDALSIKAYPTLKNEKTKAIFQKIISHDYKEILRDKDLSLGVRIPKAMDHQALIAQIMEKYFSAYMDGQEYGIEIAHLLGTMFNVSAEILLNVEDYAKNIDPKASDYKVRKDGFTLMKSGLTKQLNGTFVSVEDTEASSDEERMILVKEYLTVIIPKIIHFLEDTDKAAFKKRVLQQISVENNKEIKRLLTELTTTM
ncbi:MAG: hypothetical protein AAF617_10165 [Bacteroidota bacterium]